MVSLEPAWRVFTRRAVQEQRATGSGDRGFPHYMQDGRWQRLPLDAPSGWHDDSFYDHGNWTAGFSVGQGWLARLGADDGALPPLPALDEVLAGVATRASDDTTGDLGLLFHPAFALGHIAGFLPLEACSPAVHAARVLAGRVRNPAGYLQAFGAASDGRSAGISSIDTMMSLPLLYWAATLPGEDSALYTERARRHAVVSAEAFMRPDGSTFHHVRFDAGSGELLHRGTFQGASSDSCWSRGQAWAVAGFSWAYTVLRDPVLLEAADQAWTYFATRVPADGVVPWDFSDDGPDAPPDASASAIAAFGALVLGRVHPHVERGQQIRQASLSLLDRLSRSSVRTDPHTDGILIRACYSKPHGLGVGGAIPAGDYFYGLALAVATGRLDVGRLLGERATPPRHAGRAPGGPADRVAPPGRGGP